MTSGVEQRFHPRFFTVKEGFPGTVRSMDSGEALPGKVVDVSRDGLGFLSEERIVPGSKIKMRLNDQEIVFRLVYCTLDDKEKDKFRLGLNLFETKVDLVELFTSLELIDQ